MPLIIPNEVLQLYREMNASLLAMVQLLPDMQRQLRRLERKVDDMAKSNQDVIAEIRETKGFVASLAAAYGALATQVKNTLEKNEVDDEVVAEIDSLFQAAKDAAASTAPAIVANRS